MTILLESKFFQPRLRQEIMLRPRLLEQLTAGLQRKLILVPARAGFGKITLVTTWLATQHAWAIGDLVDQRPRQHAKTLDLDS